MKYRTCCSGAMHPEVLEAALSGSPLETLFQERVRNNVPEMVLMARRGAYVEKETVIPADKVPALKKALDASAAAENT